MHLSAQFPDGWSWGWPFCNLWPHCSVSTWINAWTGLCEGVMLLCFLDGSCKHRALQHHSLLPLQGCFLYFFLFHWYLSSWACNVANAGEILPCRMASMSIATSTGTWWGKMRHKDRGCQRTLACEVLDLLALLPFPWVVFPAPLVRCVQWRCGCELLPPRTRWASVDKNR